MRSFIIIPTFPRLSQSFFSSFADFNTANTHELTLIRTARETGKETFLHMAQRHLDGEDENREQNRAHIRLVQPHIPHHRKQRTLPCMNKLPRICPATEYAHSKGGERYLKTYNGLVQMKSTTWPMPWKWSK